MMLSQMKDNCQNFHMIFPESLNNTLSKLTITNNNQASYI